MSEENYGHSFCHAISLHFWRHRIVGLSSRLGIKLSLMDIRKAVLIFAGTVCVALGVLGMFLPLLPTTVFLLMAAYCYSRSSERFHTWLLTNRLFGTYIKNYKSGKGISMRQKISTIAMLWVSIGFSIWVLGGRFWVTLLLVAIAVGVTLHLVLLKTYRPETNPATQPAAPEQI